MGSVATNAVKPHLDRPSILLSDGFRSLTERGFSPVNQVPNDRHQTTVLQPAKRRLFVIPELGNGGGTVSKVPFYESEDKRLENREIWLKVRVTNKERQILKRRAKKVGLTVSDFVRSSLIHSDNLTINVIDTSVLSKTLFELHRHGVNLNQLMKFCNTYGLDAFNENHVIPTLENERIVFLQTKAALLSLEEEARKGNVIVNLDLEMDDDSEEEDSE